MCGRFLLTTPVAALRRLFGFAELPNLTARFNIAPGQAVAAMRLDADRQRHFAGLRWGLVPSWSRPSGGRPPTPQIHARAETVAEKPSFRDAFRSRRCVVFADGFYEWRQDGNRQPYCIRLADNGPFAFAALWEPAVPQAGEAADAPDSCALITTPANDEMAAIHHRMPVILSPGDVGLWLDPQSRVDGLMAVLQPLPRAVLSLTPVSKRVNAVKHDDAGLLEEELLPQAPSQLKLF